mmetsp:Transcript_7598/g.16149  ORF Transcript_7598/g.16149 Transcript_7598/m.16149 type:complete len:406 (-) Transcript_7598:163-1380(-)
MDHATAHHALPIIANNGAPATNKASNDFIATKPPPSDTIQSPNPSPTQPRPPSPDPTSAKPTPLPSPIAHIRLRPNGQWVENKKNGSVIPESSILQRISSHVRTCARRPYCVDVHGNYRNCQCLRVFLGEDKEDVIVNCARGLLKNYYGVPTTEGKTRYVVTQMRHAVAYANVLKKKALSMKKTKMCNIMSYLIPYEEDGSMEEDGDGAGGNDGNGRSKNTGPSWDASESQIFLCTWGFCSLLSIGRNLYTRYSRTNPVVPVKVKLRQGNTNRRKNEEIYDALRQYMEEMVLPHARHLPSSLISPSMKKKIREMNREEGEVLFLPPEFRYLRLYKDWCLHRGKVVKFKCTRLSHMYPTDQFPDRPFDDQWPEGSVSKEVFSLKTFRSFWKSEYPLLMLQAEMKDS